MKNYQCEICGKKHTIYYGVGSPEPDCMRNFSEEERDKRVEQHSEQILLIDKSFFMIKGVVFIEVKDISEWFRFEIWASIEVNYYLEKIKEYENGVTDKPIYGKLENDVFFYENTKGAKVDVIFPTEGDEVVFEVLEENHPMSVDQKNGISKEKLISWMQKMNHPESKPKSERSFQVQFEEIIKIAKEDYLAKEKSYVINVATAMVLFQIISPEVTEKEVKKNEFVIYLPFDISNEETKLELERFKQTKYFNQFELDVFDGMPTYYLAIENDDTKLIDLSSQIIKDVYEVKIEDVDFDIFEP